MLIYLYLFSLIVGAMLLGASILLGGHDDADAEVDFGDGDVGDASIDLDADLDLDIDADLDADVDGFDKDVDVGGHGGWEGVLLSFLSLRFWTFFLAFFGLTGITLNGFHLTDAWTALALAIGMGGVTGFSAVSVIRRLTNESLGATVSVSEYIGKTARVIVPLRGESVGKVRVDIGGNTVDLLATALEQDTFQGQEEVLIVEMDGSKARVARFENPPK